MENHSFIKFVPGIYVIYLSIPKVASSSISHAMLMRQPTACGSLSEHSKEGKALTNWRPAIAPHPNLPIFTFTRHPIDKFLSYYRNKFVGAREDGFELSHLRDLKFDPEMSLEEVVKHMMTIPVEKMEHHAQPQYRIVLDKRQIPIANFVGKIENIENDWKYIEALSLADFSIGDIKNTTSKLDSYEEHMSESVISALTRYYSYDFELFDYDKPAFKDMSIEVIKPKNLISKEKIYEIKDQIAFRKNGCVELVERLQDPIFLNHYMKSMKSEFNRYLIHANSSSSKINSWAKSAMKEVLKIFM